MDEKRKVIAENILLDNQLSSLKYELENFKKDSEIDIKSELNSLFQLKSEEFSQNNHKLIIDKMKIKIIELEDLIAQQSSLMDPFKISELEKIISELSIEVAEKNNLIEQLKFKIQDILKKPNFLFDERQGIYSLTQAMREKDILILDLKKALRDIKENNYKSELIRNERIKDIHSDDIYGKLHKNKYF